MIDKKTFQIKLGQHIVKLREEKSISQSELAKRCEKDRQSINKIEKGNFNPTVYYLHEIANALELPVSKLLEFELIEK